MKHAVTTLLRCTLCGAALLLPHTAVAGDSSGNYAVWGPGSASCNRYLQARLADEADPYKHYLMGWLSAYNQVTPDTYSLTGTMPITEILGWLDGFCDEHRLYGLNDALGEMAAELHERRQRRLGPRRR